MIPSLSDARRFYLLPFLRHPLYALSYRREWGEWPVIWKWEATARGN